MGDELISGLMDSLGAIPQKMMDVFKQGLDWVIDLFGLDALQPIVDTVFEVMEMVVNSIMDPLLAAQEALYQIMIWPFTTAWDVLSQIFEGDIPGAIDTFVAAITTQFNNIVKEFQPSLIVNCVRSKKDLMTGDNLLKLVEKFLNVEVTYLGYIIESDKVRDSIDEMIPFLIKDPQSKPSENLQKIIGDLTNTDLQFVKRDGRILVSKQVRLSSGWEV